MQFTTTIAAFMLSSVCSAAVLRRQSFEPQRFVVHSKPKGAECFDHSLGYLFAEYSYGGGYMATLHTGKSDAIQGYIINNALTFGDEYTQGFQLIELSDDAPNAIPQIMSGQDGTPFITVDENNLLGWHSPDGVAISWFACENWPLRWGPATALFYKLEDTETTEGCVDVDLVVEYV